MDKDKLKAFTQKIFDDMAGTMLAGLCYVGHKTGLFTVMANKGSLTQEQIVTESKLQARYVEEWLKGMVCGQYIEYDPEAKTYCLPDEHAFLLASAGTDHFAGGLFHMVPTTLAAAPEVADAFVHGGGVAFDAYHEELVEAIDLINRGNYEHRLVSYWLKAIPGLLEKLDAGCHVLDVGCGVGRVPLTLARAFPHSHFLGIDSHADSIAQAVTNAKAQDITDNVAFSTQSISQLPQEQAFDLITACDCLHDFTHPLEMLKEIRQYLKPDGMFFIIEPKVNDQLEDNQNSIATMLYGFSMFHCMTQSLAQGGAGLGTCMGPAKTEALIREAGFSNFEQLAIKSQVNAFYLVKR